MYMEPQRTLNDQRNLEKEVQAGDIRLSYFQLYYKDRLPKQGGTSTTTDTWNTQSRDNPILTQVN